MRISWRARWQSAVSILTGRVLNVGDSQFSDVKDQSVQSLTNIGLLAALVLTITVGLLVDAAYTENSNGWISTEPWWIGQAYFTCIAASTVSMLWATVGSVVVIIVLHETCSVHEVRYLIASVHRQTSMPLAMLMIGGLCLSLAYLLWLVIVCFRLQVSAITGASDSVNSSLNGTDSTDIESEEFFLGAFIGCTLSMVVESLYALFCLLDLVAALHKTRYKFAPFLAEKRLTHSTGEQTSPRSGLQRVGDRALISLYGMAQAQTADSAATTAPWFVQVSASQISSALSPYFQLDSDQVSIDGFKQYLLSQHARGTQSALSFIAEQVAERLFEEKVKHVVDEACKSLASESTSDARAPSDGSRV